MTKPTSRTSITPSKPPSRVRQAVALIGSSWFFRGIVTLLVLQAVWIACSGRYPMAFDEDYHLGLIRLYADHLSPFWSGQPPGADSLGAIFRDPSYLFHYLMSFPYRLIVVFTDNQTWQVLWLRGINIGFCAAALPLYRRLLLKTGASRAIVHSCLLLFVLLPVTPLLAAQINYDNLLLPLIALVLLLTAAISDELKRDKRLNGPKLAQLLILCLLSSLVKYPFLPIFATIVAYLMVRVWQTYKNLPALGRDMQTCARKLSWARKACYILVLLVALGLFTERYGVNLVHYHTPVPACDSALSVERCEAYGPWARDHRLAEIKLADTSANPVVYGGLWLYGMWLRLFFAVDGPGTHFETRGPLILPAFSAEAATAIGVVLIAIYRRRIFKKYNRPILALLASVTLVYGVVLFIDNYEAYARTGEPVAINGRYLLLIALPAMLFGVLAAAEALKHRVELKLALLAGLVICFIGGGGSLTYILRSNDAWYWPHTPLKGANHTIQNTVGPLVPGNQYPTEFIHH